VKRMKDRGEGLEAWLEAEAARAGPALTTPSASAGELRPAAHGVRPNRDLGQNFLVDPNILGVIERAAELSPSDVVLEVGGGLGTLSAHLAPRVAHLHVVEIDPRLEGPLLAALDGEANVSVHWGDAMRLDLAGLSPAPDKLVANLPYGIAAGLLLRTIEELPGLQSWVAMIQREVGERLAAGPGSKAYGATSVLAQLACDVRVIRGIPRTVFSPVPHVDSVLVGLRRREASPPAPVRRVVHAGFAHRRKALPRSLSLAGLPGTSVRERTRAALVEMGHPEDERAERLTPGEFVVLAGLLGAGGS
jgi:16S rRNA (adenine1518-N6/adenine1519-N6)-dimethyltransferase